MMRLGKENHRGLEAWTKGSHLAWEFTLLGCCPQLQGGKRFFVLTEICLTQNTVYVQDVKHVDLTPLYCTLIAVVGLTMNATESHGCYVLSWQEQELVFQQV